MQMFSISLIEWLSSNGLFYKFQSGIYYRLSKDYKRNKNGYSCCGLHGALYSYRPEDETEQIGAAISHKNLICRTHIMSYKS